MIQVNLHAQKARQQASFYYAKGVAIFWSFKRHVSNVKQRLVDVFDAPRSTSSCYGMEPGYRHRKQTRYYDDTSNTDEWQREVYLAAADLMRAEGLRTVYDVGCGAGYKLVHYLGEFDTTGFDLEKTVLFLKRSYPARKWATIEFTDYNFPPADVVICADVIEHVEDPDALLRFLRSVLGRYLVLSTPDRDLVYPKSSRRHRGPPRNPMHVREWSFEELRRYIEAEFEIIEHRISNREQATQMIICRNDTASPPRKDAGEAAS
jgi:SAM-dependent methyltransferase